MRKPLHPLLKHVGSRVRRLRARQGWSQEELADHAGLDRSYMSGIERGVRNVSVLTLGKVARALGVPLTSLLRGE